MHQGTLDLPAVALAIARVSELRGHVPDWSAPVPDEEPTEPPEPPLDARATPVPPPAVQP